MDKTKKLELTKTTYSEVVQINFIILKLTGLITWSWWWVLCPIWGGLALVLLMLIVIFAVKKLCM